VAYQVDILRSAQKQLAKIDLQEQDRIIDTLRSLAENPRPHGSKKLTARPAWRIRIGSYRVIYEIHDDRLTVLVINIGHRSHIYR
jgi:mRNA interferase RelE/StbE